MQPYKRVFDEKITCLICNETFVPSSTDTRSAGSKFSAHLQYTHKIKSEDYTIKHIYNNVRPTCAVPECGNVTRYVSYAFKMFCKEHAKEAMSRAGRIGGSAASPLKGETKETNQVLERLSNRMKGSGNPFFGKHHDQIVVTAIARSKTLSIDDVNERLKRRSAEWICLSDLSEYISRQKQYLQFKCVECDHMQFITLQAFERGCLCKNCYKSQVSVGQKDLADWIRVASNFSPTELSTRRIISPLELDVYLPEKDLAIEYHGLYYHSTAKDEKIDRKLMLRKFQACDEKGIKLFQFLADEWRDKRLICESMMYHALKKSPKNIAARKCNII